MSGTRERQENELILEPELPIIDTHHHLWDRNGWTYLLPELLADLNTGHRHCQVEAFWPKYRGADCRHAALVALRHCATALRRAERDH